MRYSKDKTIDETVRRLLKAGWSVCSKNRHLKIESNETRQRITVPGSPSDFRAVQNWLHQIKRLEGAACC